MNTDHGTKMGNVYTYTKHYCETSLKHVSFVSFTWFLGRAAACDCGTPWTFLLPFFKQTMKSNHDTRMGKVHTGTMHYCEKSQKTGAICGLKNTMTSNHDT